MGTVINVYFEDRWIFLNIMSIRGNENRNKTVFYYWQYNCQTCVSFGYKTFLFVFTLESGNETKYGEVVRGK